jgi:undecaprenyl-diphosphatase
VVLAHGARRDDVPGWDIRSLRFLHGYEERAQGSAFDRAVNAFLGISAELGVVIVILLVLSLALLAGRVRDAIFLVATMAVVAALSSSLKEGFERTDVKYSFPSGHAALSAAIATAAILISWPTRWRWPALAVGALCTVALGASLVYEGWHLPSDVIGGWCLAVACAGLLRASFVLVPAGRGRES